PDAGGGGAQATEAGGGQAGAGQAEGVAGGASAPGAAQERHRQGGRLRPEAVARFAGVPRRRGPGDRQQRGGAGLPGHSAGEEELAVRGLRRGRPDGGGVVQRGGELSAGGSGAVRLLAGSAEPAAEAGSLPAGGESGVVAARTVAEAAGRVAR